MQATQRYWQRLELAARAACTLQISGIPQRLALGPAVRERSRLVLGSARLLHFHFFFFVPAPMGNSSLVFFRRASGANIGVGGIKLGIRMGPGSANCQSIGLSIKSSACRLACRRLGSGVCVCAELHGSDAPGDTDKCPYPYEYVST